MAASSIVFSTIKAHSDNKKLEQDDKGYYRVILGAFNAFNESGDFYLVDGVNDLINDKSHTLARRLKTGYLKGEVGHPSYQPGMSKAHYYARILKIELSNVSHHIRDVILVPTDEASGYSNSKLVRVEAWIKPAGPYGDALKKDLDDPSINVAFSIRSLTKDTYINGVNVKQLIQIVTWYWVLEPGIKIANKFNKLSLESLDLLSLSIDELTTNGEISECFNCSLESNDDKEMTREIIKEIKNNKSMSNVVLDW